MLTSRYKYPKKVPPVDEELFFSKIIGEKIVVPLKLRATLAVVRPLKGDILIWDIPTKDPSCWWPCN